MNLYYKSISEDGKLGESAPYDKGPTQESHPNFEWTGFVPKSDVETAYDGTTWIKGSIAMPQPPSLAEKAQKMSIPKMDFMRLAVALTNQTEGMTGLTFDIIEQTVNSYTGTASAEIRMGFLYDTVIYRNDPLLDVMAEYFQIPNFSDLLDLIFVNQSKWLEQLKNGEKIG